MVRQSKFFASSVLNGVVELFKQRADLLRWSEITLTVFDFLFEELKCTPQLLEEYNRASLFFDNIENWKRYNCRENVNFSKRKIVKLIMLKLKHFKWNEIRFQHRIVGYQRGAQRDQRGSVSCTTWGGWPIGNRWTWLFAKTCLLDNGTKINWDDIKNIFGREMCLRKWICMSDSSNKKRTSGVQCRSICPLVKLRLWRKRRAGLRQNPRGRLRASSSTRWSVFQTMWIINQKSITMQIAT